jgi:sortase (surface protein transpeptidase)
MDVPRAWDRVGWYQFGALPGRVGNAVLAGHLDTNSGAPAVFWHLDKLLPGDELLIETDAMSSILFQIDSVQSYSYSQAPRNEIFGPVETPRLTLITCSGNWDSSQKLYDRRLVVTARLMEIAAQPEIRLD